jgi:hypothetical protein
MDLLYTAESVLRQAGFRTARKPDHPDVILFEDDTVLGLLAVHASAEDLVTTWREQQDHFLRANASRLRRDPQKAWNTYSVFLTQAPLESVASDVLGVEADVHATRKIVKGQMLTTLDVQEALAPLLPLAIQSTAFSTTGDATVLDKLESPQREFFQLVSNRKVADDKIVAWLLKATR